MRGGKGRLRTETERGMRVHLTPDIVPPSRPSCAPAAHMAGLDGVRHSGHALRAGAIAALPHGTQRRADDMTGWEG
jgi:hypothetical protein